MRRAVWGSVAAVMIGVVALVAPASGPGSFGSAAGAGVSDGGLLFSEEALSEARDVIRAIRQAHGRDVAVETFAAVPEELRDEMARIGRDRFYADWLERRARERGVRGVFVLVTREPGRVQVGVDRVTRRRLFTAADGEDLRETVAAAFRERQFDRGLLEGLRLVRQRMDANAAAETNPSVPVVLGAAR